MLKRRTIAILVAGCLVGAQAGIAANEQEITAVDTSSPVPVEIVAVPAETVVVVEPVLIQTDASSPASEVLVVEQTQVYIAAAEPSREVVRPAAAYRGPIEMTFKGHPMNVSESAGPSWTGDSQQLAYQSGSDYRVAHSFPMNTSETAGTTTSALESYRVAGQSTQELVMISFVSPSESPKVE